ncbi:hypothetical protein LWI28_010129 [Acer negundo]|uniref:Reverse transcriptase Ty1/copia-type domain-containing protein n=1 Tax=Acer negundo TaxID=4023 RepID=A0AAD5NUA0_ACENE|nr:hypothetical protein LWI28_010129 [Acer negundo]
MAQPPEFTDLVLPLHVCRLKKSIYGLKQAPQAWYNELRVTGNDGALIDPFVVTLDQRFSIKDLITLSYFLGLEVFSCSAGLFLSQQKYVTDFLTSTKMIDSKPVATHLPTDHTFTLLDDTSLTMPLNFVK